MASASCWCIAAASVKAIGPAIMKRHCLSNVLQTMWPWQIFNAGANALLADGGVPISGLITVSAERTAKRRLDDAALISSWKTA